VTCRTEAITGAETVWFVNLILVADCEFYLEFDRSRFLLEERDLWPLAFLTFYGLRVILPGKTLLVVGLIS